MEDYLGRALEKYREGDLEMAMAFLDKIFMFEDSMDPRARLLRSSIELFQGKLDEAYRDVCRAFACSGDPSHSNFERFEDFSKGKTKGEVYNWIRDALDTGFLTHKLGEPIHNI